MNGRRTFLVALMAAAVSGGGSGGLAAAAGAASPDFTEVVRLVQENSQQRAKALGGDRHAVVSLSASSDRDTVTGLSFSNDAADREGRLRTVLATGEPLVAGSETLQVDTGTVSVELVDTQALKSGAYVLTLLENVEYPYTDDPRGESMGESYERRVTVSDSGSGWKVLKNEVPSGSWPLVEGATAFESSSPSTTDSSWSADASTEPKFTVQADSPSVGTAATGSRSDAVDYALAYALDPNDAYRHFDQDCTNFVSQALLAGGFQRRNVGSSPTSLWAWWYDHYLVDEWSHSWSVANYNFGFHDTTNRGKVVGSYTQVTLGDLMYADWTANSSQDHVVIFTGQGTSGLKLSSHTNNRRNGDASWWAARGREDSPGVDYDYFHLDYGTF